MSKTVLANVDGFTPIIDSVAADVGIIGAAVFGRMWRYCQMENGICHAALGTISDDLGLSIRTIIRYSDKLVEHGYLKDLTPDVRNEPHRYADTGKAGIKISVEGMTESHTRYDTESQRGMTESHLKKEYKIEKDIIDVLENHTAIDLTIECTEQGGEFLKALNEHRDSIGQRHITKYKTAEQKIAFERAFAVLNGQADKLTRAALARNITSMDKLLSWLEGCARKQQKDNKPAEPKVIRL